MYIATPYLMNYLFNDCSDLKPVLQYKEFPLSRCVSEIPFLSLSHSQSVNIH